MDSSDKKLSPLPFDTNTIQNIIDASLSAQLSSNTDQQHLNSLKPLSESSSHQQYSSRSNAVTEITADSTTLPISSGPIIIFKNPDPTHEGALRFTRITQDPINFLMDCSSAVYSSLYTPFTSNLKKLKTITFYVESFGKEGGVAHTTQNKEAQTAEIHFNSDYIANYESDIQNEISGVTIHELVHCWQHDSNGSSPWWIIEGIADYIREREGWAPPHWKEMKGGKWDQGYSVTGYFLKWLESKMSHGLGDLGGFVRLLNERMGTELQWTNDVFHDFCGKTLEQLWDEYQNELSPTKSSSSSNAPVPTHT